MADIDLMPSRGVPFRAQVGPTGIALNGTATIEQLAQRGMRPVCVVDNAGLNAGVTVDQLAQRGMRAVCLVDENGLAGGVTADELRRRGIRPLVQLTAAGLSGSTTMLQLAQRGLDYACLVGESGAASGGGGGGVATPSYWNPGGYGDRTSLITASSTATFGGGTVNSFIDGVHSDVLWFNGGQSGCELKFDFGSGKVINGFRWSQGSGAVMGTWMIEGSNDDSSYTSLSTGLAIGVTLTDFQFANTVAYRYYKLRQTSGTVSSSPYVLEVEFRIGASTGSTRDALEQGDRTSSITVSTTATLGSGTINNLVDGLVTTDPADACAFTAGQSTREIKFDFGSGVTKIITGFIWSQHVSTSHGTWVFEGSNDDSGYTTLGSSFTLGTTEKPQHVTFTNTTAYRYYKLRQTAGTTSAGVALMEIEFRIV